MKVTLKTITPNIETEIVEIARVSSSRVDKKEKPEGLINYLIKNKHWSPFEHGYMTLEIDTSKAIGIQLLRHRSFTFQEFSQRYAKVEGMEDIQFRRQAEKNRQSSTEYVTTFNNDQGLVLFDDTSEIVNDDKLSNLFTRIAQNIEDSYNLYNEALEAGIAKECARFILPMATSTKIYMTGSIRSWIHFLQIRLDGHAQLEAQLIAQEIKKIFKQQLPIISNALEF